MDQERNDCADAPSQGRSWSLLEVIILSVVACLALFLILMALEVAGGIRLGIVYVYD